MPRNPSRSDNWGGKRPGAGRPPNPLTPAIQELRTDLQTAADLAQKASNELRMKRLDDLNLTYVDGLVRDVIARLEDIRNRIAKLGK